MIILDFEVDEKELNIFSKERERIETLDSSLFVATTFLMPLRMHVNGLELFENSKEDCWSPGPIMDLATDVLMTIKKLKKNREAKHLIIEGPGEFVFTMIGDDDVSIEFFACGNRYFTTVKYDKLLEAFEKYAEKVRAFLKERVPQMYDHPYWGPWLRGETECDGSKIKLAKVTDISKNIEVLTPQWYGPENPVEIFRAAKVIHQFSKKAMNEIKAVKTFLLNYSSQKTSVPFDGTCKNEEFQTREQFINFVQRLSRECYGDSDAWENNNIGLYLSAIARWTDDMDGYYLNFGLTLPENVDWQVMVNMLTAAKGRNVININEKNLREIKTRDEFVSFAFELSENYYNDPVSWENGNLETYLSAIAKWTESIDEYYKNLGLALPEKIDWEVMSDVLSAACIYE